MKIKLIVTLLICAGVPAMACAKKPKKNVEAQPQQVAETVVEEEEPTITEECVVNVSLFNESAKNKQFEDAFGPWWEVYSTCPNANKAVYTQGAKILEWKFNNATTEAEKDEIRNLIMQMHDKRIKYFGTDPKYPEAYILGEKGVDYCQFFENDPLKEKAYPWLKQSVKELKAESKITVIQKFFEVSYGLYKSNPDQYRQSFIDDYTLVSSIMMEIQADPKSKYANQAVAQKQYFDNLFASSGAASCEKLDELYADFAVNNSGYMEDLLAVLKLYQRVNCVETPVYFAIAEAAHKLQPTEESAAGCAKMCMKKEDWKAAIEYYEQAVSLISEETEDNRDDYYLAIAKIQLSQLKNYPAARTYARLASEANPSQGMSYLIIGMAYASSHPYSSQDMPAAKAAILNKTVFWAAVDQFVKAKNIDATCTNDANNLISSYSKYFPTKEEMFDLPNEFGGGTFIVGGWINERTTCR